MSESVLVKVNKNQLVSGVGNVNTALPKGIRDPAVLRKSRVLNLHIL